MQKTRHRQEDLIFYSESCLMRVVVSALLRTCIAINP